MRNRTDFVKSYDIVVVGAGIAGIAAAISSASTGASTILIEKSFTPGGLAVSGFVNIFLPLCDGCGNQILFGLAEELLKLSVKYSPFSLPSGWGGIAGKRISRYTVKFSPAAFALSLERLVLDSNVELIYDTLVCDTECDKQNRIRCVYVENLNGRGKISGKVFIDATGNASLSKNAGAEITTHSNSLSSWSLQASPKNAKSAVEYDDPEMLLEVLKLGSTIKDFYNANRGNASKQQQISAEEATRFMIAERELIRTHYEKISNGAYPIALSNIPHMRMIRTVRGRDSVRNEADTPVRDSIGFLPDWRRSGVVYPVPTGALLAKSIPNLLLAGRIISAEHGNATEVIRVIPSAAFTGENAGRIAVESI